MTSSEVLRFVSDVHLRYGDEPYLRQFLDFLEETRSRARTLYVVGDLFEFWIGDRQGGLDFYRPLFDRLEALTSEGVLVKVIHGNRDFLIGKRFARAGCELLPDEIVLRLGGRQVHVSHGDQFCIEDVSYQRARVVMRSPPVRWIATWLPAFVGLFLARSYRGISENKKAAMKVATGNRFHTIEEGVRREFRRGGHDVVLCGHIHFLADQQIEVDGVPRRVLTTGAWEEGPNYVEFDGAELRLETFSATAS